MGQRFDDYKARQRFNQAAEETVQFARDVIAGGDCNCPYTVNVVSDGILMAAQRTDIEHASEDGRIAEITALKDAILAPLKGQSADTALAALFDAASELSIATASPRDVKDAKKRGVLTEAKGRLIYAGGKRGQR